MANNFACELCSKTFRSQSGAEWHTDHSHLLDEGLLVTLDLKWRGIPTFTVEKPGEFCLVLPAITLAGAKDPDMLEATMQPDIDRTHEIIQVINKVNEQLRSDTK